MPIKSLRAIPALFNSCTIMFCFDNVKLQNIFDLTKHLAKIFEQVQYFYSKCGKSYLNLPQHYIIKAIYFSLSKYSCRDVFNCSSY